MDSYHNGDFFVFQGFHVAIERTKSSAYQVYYKVLDAQKQFFTRNESGFSAAKQNQCNDLLDEAMHKFYLGSFALEQLWGVKNYLEYPEKGLPSNIEQNITYLHNETTFLLSFLLDQSLYCWRSFLDYYLKYLLYFCTGIEKKTMSTKEFKKTMENHLKSQNDERAKLIYLYLCNRVFCNTFTRQGRGWGDFLKELRDKTTHRKLIRPTIVTKKNQAGYEITWPTIGNQTYSDLIQLNFENNAFEMIREFSPLLYKEQWKPGTINIEQENN